MHEILAILNRTFGGRAPLLPSRFDTVAARHQLISISGQEADLRHRWQVVDANRPNVRGPARGLWQFELGTERSRGGVWGVYLHPASRPWLEHACGVAGVAFNPRAVWLALEANDGLACAVARALLLTDPRPLPGPGQVQAAWDCYNRNWRPGKPHPDDWPDNYARATRIMRDGGLI